MNLLKAEIMEAVTRVRLPGKLSTIYSTPPLWNPLLPVGFRPPERCPSPELRPRLAQGSSPPQNSLLWGYVWSMDPPYTSRFSVLTTQTTILPVCIDILCEILPLRYSWLMSGFSLGGIPDAPISHILALLNAR